MARTARSPDGPDGAARKPWSDCRARWDSRRTSSTACWRPASPRSSPGSASSAAGAFLPGPIGPLEPDAAVVMPLTGRGPGWPRRSAGGRGQPLPSAGRGVPGVLHDGQAAGRCRADRCGGVRESAPAGAGAGRSRPGQDGVLPERQPRIAHAADPAAGAVAGPAGGIRRGGLSRSATTSRPRCGRRSGCTGWWMRCWTSPARRRAPSTRICSPPIWAGSRPTWPACSGPPPNTPGCDSRSSCRRHR